MYSLMKSRRIQLDNMYESAVMYCCFLNNQDILIVFQSKTIDVVSTIRQNEDRIIASFQIQSKYGFVDCKRICENNCIILTEQYFYHVVYDSGKLMVKEIQSNIEILENISANSRLVSFRKGIFAIVHQVYLDKIAYFMIFDLNQGLKNAKAIKFQQLSWINQHYSIIKPLQNTLEFVIFKQTQQQQNQWTLKIISIQNDIQAKIIDLRDRLSEKHTIIDVIAKGKDEYYVFVKNHTDSYYKIEVRSCILLKQYKQFTPSWNLLYKLDLINSNISEIICCDSKSDYFITRNYCLEQFQGEIYTNFMQIRKLSTGSCMSRLPCNLKSWDFNIDFSLLVDYSQELEALQKIVIHVRTFFNKKSIFAYLLEHNQILERERINNSFKEMILSLL